ncbi:MAG: M48 family metalloprotease [Candidatus Eremiobacteraeota bacterium]|nr:M48 family metalloprotease [Candidatus Eremiobacteraeota bacterium]
MDSIDPVQFARSYIEKLIGPGSFQAPEAAPDTPPPHDEMMWYGSESKTVPGRPPSLTSFDRDIRKLREAGASERVINSYLGLSLLAAVAAAVQAGVGPLAGPLYVGIASALGRELAGPDTEKECGRKAYAEIVGKSGISKDPAMNGRAADIAGKLLTHSKLDGSSYKVLVLATEEINAHSLPGYLFVTEGMLRSFPEDGQVALFMGHEIAHAEDRDSLEGIGQDMFEHLAISSTLLKSKVKVEGSEKTVGDIRKALKEGYYDATTAHERENELNADRRGAQLLVAGGFSPADACAAISAICRIEEEGKLKVIRNQVQQALGYVDEAEVARRLVESRKFDNHPAVAERLEAVKKGAGNSEKA